MSFDIRSYTANLITVLYPNYCSVLIFVLSWIPLYFTSLGHGDLT